MTNKNRYTELKEKRPAIVARMEQMAAQHSKVVAEKVIDPHGNDPKWLRDLIVGAADYINENAIKHD